MEFFDAKCLLGWFGEEPLSDANSCAVITIMFDFILKYPQWKKDDGNDTYSPVRLKFTVVHVWPHFFSSIDENML
jgi:hypothetical protein